MTELKPCPFCGSDAKILYESVFGSDDSTHYFRIRCLNNACTMGYPGVLYSSKQNLIDDWNTRVDQSKE